MRRYAVHAPISIQIQSSLHKKQDTACAMSCCSWRFSLYERSKLGELGGLEVRIGLSVVIEGLHALGANVVVSVEHDRDDRHVLADGSADLTASGLALLLVLNLTGGQHSGVHLRVAVLLVVVVSTGEEVRVQEVVHGRIVGSPAKAAEAEVLVGQLLQVGSPLDGLLGDLDTHGLEVELNGGHEVAVIAVAVVVQRDLDIALAVGVGGVTGLIEELGGSLGIVLAVLPDVLGGIVDGGRHDGGSRHTGALEQGVDDVLAVDGQGDGATDLRVGEVKFLKLTRMKPVNLKQNRN